MSCGGATGSNSNAQHIRTVHQAVGARIEDVRAVFHGLIADLKADAQVPSASERGPQFQQTVEAQARVLLLRAVESPDSLPPGYARTREAAATATTRNAVTAWQRTAGTNAAWLGGAAGHPSRWQEQELSADQHEALLYTRDTEQVMAVYQRRDAAEPRMIDVGVSDVLYARRGVRHPAEPGVHRLGGNDDPFFAGHALIADSDGQYALHRRHEGAWTPVDLDDFADGLLQRHPGLSDAATGRDLHDSPQVRVCPPVGDSGFPALVVQMRLWDRDND